MAANTPSSTRISTSLTAPTFDRVFKLAGTEKRSLSSMAEILIERGLDAGTPLTEKQKELLAMAEELGGLERAIEALGSALRMVSAEGEAR